MPHFLTIANKFISCLAVATLTLGAIDRASAQPSTAPSPTPTVTPKPNSPNPPTPPTKPATEKSIEERANLDLLTKAVQLFWQSDRCQFDSEIRLEGKMGAESLRMTVRTRATSQLGNKFRADVTLQNTESSPVEKYTIVSNGKRVWIYQPDKKIYTQMTWAKFDREQSFVFGFASVFFNQLSEAERKKLIIGKELSKTLAAALRSADPKDFNGKFLPNDNQEFGGKPMYVYTFDGSQNAQIGAKIVAAVEPATGKIEQMKLSGSSYGIDFIMTENIRSRTNNVSITAQTFKFIPPKGVKRVKSIPINMFGSK